VVRALVAWPALPAELRNCAVVRVALTALGAPLTDPRASLSAVPHDG